MEETNNNSIGETLKRIRRGDVRKKLKYNEETGDFEIAENDSPDEEGTQDATSFAEEGFA